MAIQYTAARKRFGYFAGPERWMARARDFICPVGPIVRRVPENATHLDIGCGRGTLLGVVAVERGARSFGCEVSENAAAAARHSLDRLARRSGCYAPTVVHASTSDLWPIGPFDVVTIVDVLHHVGPAEQTRFLSAAAARVRVGGVLIFKDMALYPKWKRMMNTLHDLVVAGQLIHYMPLDEVIKSLKKEGLELKETDRYSSLWYAHELAVLQRSV